MPDRMIVNVLGRVAVSFYPIGQDSIVHGCLPPGLP